MNVLANSDLPVAIIGAGPVGMAAAAHLIARGMTPVLLERGRQVGASVADWGHVQLFSPWRYNIDSAAAKLLEETGWERPDDDVVPTGRDLVNAYLSPLAAHPKIAPALLLQATVEAVVRQGRSRLGSEGRSDAPFELVWRDKQGRRQRLTARAVIDASGTWTDPNPMGLDGLPVEGEAENTDRIAYGIPDAKGAASDLYAGKRVLVVGAGHSAINAVLDLLDLQDHAPDTKVFWATRNGGIARLLGGGLNDQLPGRGQLGLAAVAALKSGRLSLLSPYAAKEITRNAGGLTVSGELAGKPHRLDLDRIIVATGFRPDLAPLRELRLALDPIVEAPVALAPLIDPNLHSCGTVPPHGVVELEHPEKDFFIAGMKSYGRAPTFLMATGYEQVRSIAAELAGDFAAARNVRLVLPETGVCFSDRITGVLSGCCGGPSDEASVCCQLDAGSKTAGAEGCGCNSTRPKAANSCCTVPA